MLRRLFQWLGTMIGRRSRPARDKTARDGVIHGSTNIPMPLFHASTGRSAERRGRRGRSGPTRVAIVEDNAFQRGAIERMLSKAGFQCSVYEDPKAAIDGIAADPVDVVVSDVFLPGCDGFELVERLRMMVPDLACVLVTSHESDEIPMDRRNAAIVLHKPVSAAMLTDAMRQVAG